MDFVVGLLRVRSRFNALWVIIDCLTKSAHFILIKDNNSTDQLGQVYAREIVRLYGVPKNIVLNRPRK